jgi:integrase
MRAMKRRPYSILGRFMELRMALKAMAPNVNTAWILKPNGMTIRQMLAPTSRPMTIPDAEILFLWGVKLIDGAQLDAPRRHGLVQFRDGLLIAMLAARGRRLRSMALLRLGHEFFRFGDNYRVELQPRQVKTKVFDGFSLPSSLTFYIEKYLASVRPALLRDQCHNALWVGIDGRPLEAKGIQQMVCKRTKARFGVSFGPHRFRHAIATTVPLKAPEAPGLAAALLGISRETVQEHYDRASQVKAVNLFQTMLETQE